MDTSGMTSFGYFDSTRVRELPDVYFREPRHTLNTQRDQEVQHPGQAGNDPGSRRLTPRLHTRGSGRASPPGWSSRP